VIPALAEGHGALEAARGRIAIVAAMPEELSRLLARATHRRSLSLGSSRAFEATIAGRDAVLVATGEGSGRASQACRALLSELPIGGLIVAGVAGGLSPSLAPGSVIVARRVVDDGETAPAPDRRWAEAAQGCGNAVLGTILSSSSMLCTRDAKAGAYARLGTAEPAVVDLESATLARVAAAHGVPYIAVRAVCDTVDENLPLDFNRYCDDSGKLDRFRLARVALSRPALIAPLWHLRRRVATCSERLAELIHRNLERGMA
jgi:adenosylhomocysteine nucleosidase